MSKIIDYIDSPFIGTEDTYYCKGCGEIVISKGSMIAFRIQASIKDGKYEMYCWGCYKKIAPKEEIIETNEIIHQQLEENTRKRYENVKDDDY